MKCAGLADSSNVRRAWNTVKLSPGTPAGAIQLAGAAPLNTRGSCAPIAAETATIDAKAKRQISA
jgi:hypothetical protein